MKAIATRLGLSQAASGMISGVFIPFFGAFLAWRGLSAGQIGLLLSLALIGRALTGPAGGIVADARNDRRSVMLFLYWIVFLGYLALVFAASPLLIFVCGILAYVAFGAASPLLESVCVRLAAAYGFDYGKVRVWASTAFVAMNVLGGIAANRFGIFAVAPLLALGGALCIIATIILPAPPARGPRGDLSGRLKATLAETRELISSGVFLVFLLAASCEQASHGFYYGYGGLHWRQIGYSETLIGIIWPLGVLAEIVLFSQAPRLLARFTPARLIMLGGLVCVVRWTIQAFDPPLPVVIFAQFLHGGTFALAHLGAVFFIQRAVPPRLAATAQSLYFVSSQGVMMGISTFISGSFYGALGGFSYLFMSVFGAAGVALAVLLARRWHGGRIVTSAPDEFVYTI